MLRSERMLNIEKFYDELRELKVMPLCFSLIDGRLEACTEQCACCQFDKGEPDCAENCKNWLFTEYKEPEVDWSEVKVDTPIYVRDKTSAPWVTAHFAKYEEGKVCSWFGGCTSFTSEAKDDYYSWNYAKLAESEETVWQRSELQKNQIQEICNILN